MCQYLSYLSYGYIIEFLEFDELKKIVITETTSLLLHVQVRFGDQGKTKCLNAPFQYSLKTFFPKAIPLFTCSPLEEQHFNVLHSNDPMC